MVSDMLAFFFDLSRFRDDLQEFSADEIKRRYEAIVEAAIEVINSELIFGRHELRRIGNTYTVSPIDASPTIDAPSIKVIDRPYIKDMANRAHRDIEQGDCDSALTKARTLLEKTFCQVIECRGGESPRPAAIWENCSRKPRSSTASTPTQPWIAASAT